MNCKQCGQPLPEGTAFCANCGAKQEQITSANEQVIIKSKKGSLLTFNLVMLGVGIVAFIIVWICLRAVNSHYTDTSELFAESLPYMLSWVSIPLIIILAVANLILAGMKCDITVTDKRVYGKSNFGKQVDLPFDAISAVAVFNLFKGVSVATSSGQISAFFHNTIFDFL